MTNKEKIIVKNAIDELVIQDGDFTGAIYELCKLVDIHYPAGKSIKNIKEIPINEVPLNSKFIAPNS